MFAIEALKLPLLDWLSKLAGNDAPLRGEKVAEIPPRVLEVASIVWGAKDRDDVLDAIDEVLLSALDKGYRPSPEPNSLETLLTVEKSLRTFRREGHRAYESTLSVPAMDVFRQGVEHMVTVGLAVSSFAKSRLGEEKEAGDDGSLESIKDFIYSPNSPRPIVQVLTGACHGFISFLTLTVAGATQKRLDPWMSLRLCEIYRDGFSSGAHLVELFEAGPDAWVEPLADVAKRTKAVRTYLDGCWKESPGLPA